MKHFPIRGAWPKRLFSAFALLMTSGNSSVFAEPVLVHFQTADGGQIEAALFEAGKERAVVFAHGAVFDKESWFFLCERLQREGIAALSIDFRGYGNSKAGSTNDKAQDVNGALDFLEGRGYKSIGVAGGSMGGAAVLNALAQEERKSVDKAVLLAPAGGPAISSGSISKLFVVSKEEGLYARVVSIHEKSAAPKELKVYAGSAHAQHLFKSEHADDLTKRIVAFLKD